MSNNTQKTIFITASRGFIVRNILRSGILNLLKQDGFRIVVFFNSAAGEIPQSLRDEFEDSQVALENVRCPARKRGHVRFARITAFLIPSRSTWYFSQIGSSANLNRAPYWKYVELFISNLVGRIGILKTVMRAVEQYLFTYKQYGKYFDRYNPALVFSTSVVSGSLDIDMMKEAKRRGIKTVSMPKGWDNVTRVLYRFEPDRLIVQNELMKDAVVPAQRIKREKVIVAGFPQFDWYRRPEILRSREEYLSSLGLDPRRKLIFFGSEGRWAPHDDVIAALLVQWIKENATSVPCSLLIRPHFSDVKNKRFEKFAETSAHVVVDRNFTVSDFFGDNWNPGVEETKRFTNLLYHSDILVTTASTLSLDAACFDTPLINIAFGVLYHPKTGKDISRILYDQTHFDWVRDTNAIDMVESREEFLVILNNYLLHPQTKSKERKLLIERLCYRVDGHSSKRIADVIKSLLRQEK